MVDELDVDAGFTRFVQAHEPRLRAAAVAAYGRDVGSDAVSEAMTVAWERWSEVSQMANPAGYVYGIARNLARRATRRRSVSLPRPPDHLMPDVEPKLPGALSSLPDRQRQVVVLVHGLQWTHQEVAELLGLSRSTVQNHLERGLRRLRRELGDPT